MDVGAVSLGWSGTPLSEVFEQIAAIGGECVEVNGNAQRHHDVDLQAPTAPRQVLTWADDAGVAVRSLSGYCDFAQTDTEALAEEVTRLLRYCRAASRMNVPVVRAFVGDVKPGITLPDVRDNIVAAFKDASQEAKLMDITLGIENHGHLINDGPALAALVDEVGADNLGFTVDTGNFAWAGHDLDEVRADFAAVLPRIVNVHVKDGKWIGEGFVFVPAGEGELPLRWLLEALAARSYAGPVYSEYEGSGNVVEGTRRSIDYLKGEIASLA
jgi:sugar phosphate isomerase/epimerase